MSDVGGIIGGLFIYPIKGCHAVAVGETTLHSTGLQHDRRWALATPSGRVLTQREAAKLATARPGINPDGHVDVQIDGQRLPLGEPTADQPFEVQIFKDRVLGHRQDGDVAQAFSDLLGREAVLVHFPASTERACDPTFAPPSAHTLFADGFPLLVTATSSLVWLDEHLLELGAEPVPMDRFRPNIVLDETPAYAEDEHSDVIVQTANASIRLELVKPCTRCVVTTIDQESGIDHGDQPLSALKRLRRHPIMRQPIFGQNAVPDLADDAQAVLRIGDAVTLTGSGAII